MTVLFAVFLAGGLPLTAQTCDRSGCGTLAPGCGGTPAAPAPRNLWGELQPVDTRLPLNRDATAFNEFLQSYSSFPWYTGVDIENGTMITSVAYGLQVWDIQTDPANPALVGTLPFTAFPTWVDSAEEKWPLQDVDAPAGNDSVAAIVGHAGIGIGIVDLTNKSMPRLLYQNSKKVGEEVYAATIGGTQYAFLAASGGDPSGGLYMYNMTQAHQFSGCSESIPAPGETTNCPGVFRGKLGNRGSVLYVHGVDNYVVLSSGAGRGFEIWDLSNAANPQLKLTGLSSQSVYGVAMWKNNNGGYNLALRTEIYNPALARVVNTGEIYDVSCIGGTCGGLGSPLWSQEMDSGTPNFFVTFSRGGSTPFLYFGSDDKCRGGSQREWLFDVSNPSAPHDLTPPTGYWGWYYRGSATGFNNVMPRRGKFNGSFFYRAALSVMDIHQRTGGVPPLPDFDWTPNPAYSGAANAVTFNDRSSGAPTRWTWSFAGSAGPSISSSSAQNPVVTFSAPGTVTVTLTAANSAGSAISPVTKTVTVASPAPAVASVAVVPNPAFICQTVSLTANGVTGQPAPALSWVIKKGGVPLAPQPPGLGNGASASWDTSAAPAGNDYTATVTASNSAGTASQTSATITLNAPPPLPAAGAFTPTYDGQPADPPAGTVTFHVNAPGASAWNWDFGDGRGFRGYVTDPILGPNPPAVSYTSIGTKQVVVLIKNCVTAERQSAALSVRINVTTPLLALFQPNLFCQFGQCFGSVGVGIDFTDSSTGAQFWDYDWNHTGADAATCSFTDSGHSAAVTSHTYTAQGNFQPCLRVRRGNSEQNIQVGPILNISSANPPSITIAGPASGQVGQSLGFSASAANCNANTGTWSWTMTGGTPSSGSGSSVTVSYGAVGTYFLSVTNSNCSGATGTWSVNVSTVTTGGSLTAAFLFSPGTPSPGQAVTFDGTATTGGPSQYSWNFGDGNNGSGVTASHTYAGAGTYSVTLTVTKAGEGPGCFSGICANALTKNVVVGGGSLAAAFGFSPGAPNIGQAVSFDAGASTGSPTLYSWSFGDGGTGTGTTASHTYAGAGTFSVTLTVSAPGTGSGCSSGTCVNQITKPVIVSPPPLDASFTTSAQCVVQFGFNQCNAHAGDAVTLTATTTQATTYSWDFGDGTPTGSGPSVSHAWAAAGPYIVKLTVANGRTSSNQSTPFQITGVPRVAVSPVLLPWVAQSRGVLAQSSDLYVHNPGSDPIDVTLEFRKRGTPDVNPPRVTRTIAPGQTLLAADVLGSLFSRENLTGFISLVVSKGATTPIITSYNTVSHTDGTQFGQALGGISMPSSSLTASAAATSVQHLVGLNDNTERTAVFGITNPTSSVTTYHLSFFDNQGRAIGHSSDVVLSPFGQRQFQLREIRDTFGISATDDYRVKVETAGGQFFPYDSDLRNGSSDPSYFAADTGKSSKVYLLGALSAPDGSGSLWKTDVVLTNTTDQVTSTTMTFTRIGLRSTPEHPITVTLGAGETKRLSDVVADQWKLSNAAGVLTFKTAGASGVYPIVQGESYDDAHTFQFGQAMAAFADGDAAGTGQTQYLVGLRQSASYRTQLWLFNPDTQGGSYDLIYRGLDGAILGRINNFILAPGTSRQVRPVDHPIPAAGVTGGFTVQIVVHTGKVLAAGQVINARTGDPAYVSGKTQ